MAEPEPLGRPGLPANDGRHPLESGWRFWYESAANGGEPHTPEGAGKNGTGGKVEKVAPFATLEDFWIQYAHLRPPSALPRGTSLYLLRDAPELTPASKSVTACDRWVLQRACARLNSSGGEAGGGGADGGERSGPAVGSNGAKAESADVDSEDDALADLWKRVMCMAVGEMAGAEAFGAQTAWVVGCIAEPGYNDRRIAKSGYTGGGVLRPRP